MPMRTNTAQQSATTFPSLPPDDPTRELTVARAETRPHVGVVPKRVATLEPGSPWIFPFGTMVE